MAINVVDAVEKKTVAIGTAIINLGGNSVGVQHCNVQPNQQLQLEYSYNLVNTATGSSQSAKCTSRPGGGMMTATFELN